MGMKRLALLFACSLIAACTNPIPSGETVSFTVTGRQAAQTLDRLDPMTVRTFARSGLARQELTALPCTATGTGLRATFISPATLAVPTYRGRTDPITVSCRRRSDTVQSASRVVSPTNQTEEDLDTGLRIGVSSSEGLDVRLGVSIRDKSRDRFDYPSSVLIDFPG